MTIPEIILTSFGGSALLLGAVGFLVKSIINHFLSKDVENFKNRLELTAVEHKIRFSNLHEKRALIISKLFELISEVHQLAKSFTSPLGFVGEDKMKEFEDTYKKISDLSNFFDKNRIYFSEDTCNGVEELIRSFRDPTIKFGVTLSEDLKKEKIKAWTEAWEDVDKKVPPIRQRLESEFRGILGSNK